MEMMYTNAHNMLYFNSAFWDLAITGILLVWQTAELTKRGKQAQLPKWHFYLKGLLMLLAIFIYNFFVSVHQLQLSQDVWGPLLELFAILPLAINIIFFLAIKISRLFRR